MWILGIAARSRGIKWMTILYILLYTAPLEVLVNDLLREAGYHPDGVTEKPLENLCTDKAKTSCLIDKLNNAMKACSDNLPQNKFNKALKSHFSVPVTKEQDTGEIGAWANWTTEGKIEWPDYQEITIFVNVHNSEKSKILIKTVPSCIVHLCNFILQIL